MVRYTQTQTHTVSTAQFGCLHSMEAYTFSAHVHSDEFTWISVHCFSMNNFDSFNSTVALGCYVRDATQKSLK